MSMAAGRKQFLQGGEQNSIINGFKLCLIKSYCFREPKKKRDLITFFHKKIVLLFSFFDVLTKSKS